MHRAILAATIENLAATGYRGLTIEGVAAKAGVAKTTIYRRWSSKLDLVLEALWGLAQRAPMPQGENVREEARTYLRGLIAAASDPVMVRVMGDLFAEALRNPELDLARRSGVAARRTPFRAALERAVDCGELPEDLDYDLIMDLISGPVFYRALVTRAPLEPGLAERIVDAVLGSEEPARYIDRQTPVDPAD